MVCGLLRRFTPRNDSTHTSSLREFVELVAISVWGTKAVKQNSSLRGFEKAVAISFILGLSLRELLATRGNLDMATTIPNQNSSLREPKVRGNLGMEHYDSQTKFCGNP